MSNIFCIQGYANIWRHIYFVTLLSPLMGDLERQLHVLRYFWGSLCVGRFEDSKIISPGSSKTSSFPLVCFIFKAFSLIGFLLLFSVKILILFFSIWFFQWVRFVTTVNVFFTIVNCFFLVFIFHLTNFNQINSATFLNDATTKINITSFSTEII